MSEKTLGMVPLMGCRCRCGHEWLPRNDEKPARVPQVQKPELGPATKGLAWASTWRAERVQP